MYNLNQVKLNFLPETVQRLENVSDEEYFGEKYKDFISNSLLKLINPDEGGSPTKFLTGFDKKKSAGALELGTAVHQMILEKGKYYVNDVEKPPGKIGQVMEVYHKLLLEGMEEDEAITEACKQCDYYKTSLTQNRIDKVLESGKEYLAHLQEMSDCKGCITLTGEHLQKLEGCLKSVKANPLITELLETEALSFNEDVMTMGVKASMVSPDPYEFGDDIVMLNLKAKIDNWSVDVENKILTLNDLKTTGMSIAAFGGTTYEVAGLDGNMYVKKGEGSFQKFHYYRQMSMYAYILRCYAEQTYGFDDTWTFNVNMLVVETNAPHLSHVFSVTQPWLSKGEMEFQSLLKRIAFHKVHGYDTFTDINLKAITKI